MATYLHIQPINLVWYTGMSFFFFSLSLYFSEPISINKQQTLSTQTPPSFILERQNLIHQHNEIICDRRVFEPTTFILMGHDDTDRPLVTPP